MAPAKAPYDPVKALEGMFNGSVTRIAYALKDPVNFGAPTKTILTECAKRFHDALDDCEIQLLDAKWYLEDQLAQNKARREAKAREMGTAAKRKHDEIKEVIEGQERDETLVKRAKVEPAKDTQIVTPKPISKLETQSQPPPPKPIAQPTQKLENKPAKPELKLEKTMELRKEEETQPLQDDFAKPTPQATPSGTNDDFNFESMFGDPPGDLVDLKDDNDDLGFDLGMDDTFNTTSLDAVPDTQDPSSLDSLLPGVDTFANQSGDVGGNNNSGNNTTSSANPENTDMGPSAFSNDFGLPEIGSANIFDDFLNDDSLNDGGAYPGNSDMMNSNFLNMDLDVDDTFFQ